MNNLEKKLVQANNKERMEPPCCKPFVKVIHRSPFPWHDAMCGLLVSGPLKLHELYWPFVREGGGDPSNTEGFPSKGTVMQNFKVSFVVSHGFTVTVKHRVPVPMHWVYISIEILKAQNTLLDCTHNFWKKRSDHTQTKLVLYHTRQTQSRLTSFFKFQYIIVPSSLGKDDTSVVVLLIKHHWTLPVIVCSNKGTRDFFMFLSSLSDAHNNDSWHQNRGKIVAMNSISEMYKRGCSLCSHQYDIKQKKIICLRQYAHDILTHWGRGKMAANFLTTISNASSWMKIYKI